MKLHKLCPLESHELADKLPMIEGPALKQFDEQVKKDGRITHAIVIVRKGDDIGFGRKHEGPDKIIAGRNRIVVALDNGIKWDDIPKRDFDVTKDGPIEQFVLREDVTGRRHLDGPQRALIAAALSKTLLEQEKKVKAAGVTAAAGDTTDADTGKKGDKPKDGGRKSHDARKKAAKALDVSEDAVKKANAISPYKDLVDAVQKKTMSLDAAAQEAATRRNAEKAKKKEKQLVDERKDAIQSLKETYGEKNLFVARVTSGKIFGKPNEDLKGHKDLLTFVELTTAQQKAFMPLLFEGLSLKEAQELQASKPEQDWTARELTNYAILNGLGSKAESKKFDFDGCIVEVSLNREQTTAIKAITSKA